MKKHKLLAIAMLIAKLTYTLTISGIVRNAENKKMSEVNIYALDKNIGTTTDGEGKFLLEGCNTEDTLIFSSIGYQEKRVAVNGLKNMKNIVLVADTYMLDEISILSITPKELLQMVVQNYSNNYSNRPTHINCNYNEYIIQKEKIISATLCQGELNNYFSLKPITGLQNKFIPKTIIKYSDHGKYSNRQYVSYNTLFNYINLYPSIYALLQNIDKIREYSLTEETIGDYKIYKLYLQGKQKTIFYIEKQSKAIIGVFRQNNYDETPSILKNDSCGFTSKKRIGSNTYISYRPYKGKWYLHTIKNSMQIEYTTSQEKINLEAKSTFQANYITEDVLQKTPHRLIVDLSKPIYNQLQKFNFLTTDTTPENPEIPNIEYYK